MNNRTDPFCGYYLFLGRGDWGTSREKTLDPTFGGNVPTQLLGDWGPHRKGTDLADAPEWSSAWGPDEWKQRVDFLADELGADTLILCMNGYELPYPSEAFPEAVERDHANVRREFLQELLDYARDRGLTLGASLCTTGHARGYAQAHPELTVVGATGQDKSDNLCHNNPGGRHYAQTVTREILTRYRGFEWVSFHPPENTQACRCEHCARAFAAETGTDFVRAGAEQVTDFYWRSCLRFQRRMELLAAELVPAAKFFSFTIPGTFEKHFDAVEEMLPDTTMLVHWDYWSYGQRIPELLTSLDLFRSRGHRVGFAASSGWSLDKLGERYGESVLDQIRAVRGAGIRDLLYFVGAIWHEASLRATSWKLHGKEGNTAHAE